MLVHPLAKNLAIGVFSK